MGRLRQAALRRSRSCPCLSGSLYPPHRYLRAPLDRFRWTERSLPLQGLPRPQPPEGDDPRCRGVPSPLPAPRSARSLRAHPPLRVPRQPCSCSKSVEGPRAAPFVPFHRGRSKRDAADASLSTVWLGAVDHDRNLSSTSVRNRLLMKRFRSPLSLTFFSRFDYRSGRVLSARSIHRPSPLQTSGLVVQMCVTHVPTHPVEFVPEALVSPSAHLPHHPPRL